MYDNEICEHCGKGELIPIEYEGIVVCNNCFIKYTIHLSERKAIL